MSDSLVYRRAVSLFNAAERCEGEMEDDFHHFRIWLRHDGERIVEMGGEALRFPWTTCGSGAVGQLSSLEGLSMKPLREQLSREQRYRQCTHLYDLVGHRAGSPQRRATAVSGIRYHGRGRQWRPERSIAMQPQSAAGLGAGQSCDHQGSLKGKRSAS